MSKKPDDPEPTAQEQAASEVAVEQWNDYASNWSPAIQRWAQNVTKDSTDLEKQATGMTNADIAQATSGTEHSLGMAGMSPNSGKVMSSLSEASTQNGSARADASVSARQGVEDTRLSNLGTVAALGMGQKATATDGIQDIAASSVESSLANAMDDQSKKYNTANLVAGVGGSMAAGLYYGKKDTPTMETPQTLTT